jgi:hypothetical protein
MTLGATSEACGHQVRNLHVVAHANGFMTKLTKPPFTYKREYILQTGALLHALFPLTKEQSMQQSQPLSVNDSFVGFIPGMVMMMMMMNINFSYYMQPGIAMVAVRKRYSWCMVNWVWFVGWFMVTKKYK